MDTVGGQHTYIWAASTFFSDLVSWGPFPDLMEHSFLVRGGMSYKGVDEGVVLIVCTRGLIFTIRFFENGIKSNFMRIFDYLGVTCVVIWLLALLEDFLLRV